MPSLSPFPAGKRFEKKERISLWGKREEDRAALERGGNERETNREIKEPAVVLSHEREREREREK